MCFAQCPVTVRWPARSLAPRSQYHLHHLLVDLSMSSEADSDSDCTAVCSGGEEDDPCGCDGYVKPTGKVKKAKKCKDCGHSEKHHAQSTTTIPPTRNVEAIIAKYKPGLLGGGTGETVFLPKASTKEAQREMLQGYRPNAAKSVSAAIVVMHAWAHMNLVCARCMPMKKVRGSSRAASTGRRKSSAGNTASRTRSMVSIGHVLMLPTGVLAKVCCENAAEIADSSCTTVGQ